MSSMKCLVQLRLYKYMNKKIRILHVHNMLDLGGTSYLVNLTAAMNSIKFENHIAYCGDEFYLGKIIPNTKLFKYSNANSRFFSYATLIAPIKIFFYIKRHKIDIVQTYMLPSCIYGLLAGILAGKPVINLIVESVLLGQKFNNILIKHTKLGKLYFRMYTKYNAMARYSISEYQNLFKLPFYKFNYVGHGVYTDKFYPCEKFRKEFRDEYGIGDDVFIIGSVGRFAKEKSLDTLILAISSIKIDDFKFALFLIGDGPCKTELKEIVIKHGLSDVVFFTGPRFDTDRVMNGIDMHIYCGPRPLIGNSNMEAMSCGKILVTIVRNQLDRRIAAELINDRQNGFILDDFEELPTLLYELINCRKFLSSISKNARSTIIKNFDFERHVELISQTYEDCCAEE